MTDMTYSVLNPDDPSDMPLVEYVGTFPHVFVKMCHKSLIPGKYQVTVTSYNESNESVTRLYGMTLSDMSAEIRLNNGKTVNKFDFA